MTTICFGQTQNGLPDNQRRDTLTNELYFFRIQQDPLTQQEKEFQYTRTLLIQGNKDTLTRNITLVTGSSGLYLESFNERRKFYPADLFGFQRSGVYYRSATGREGRQLFAERMVKGPISFYSGTVPAQSGGGRKKVKAEEFYFITGPDSLSQLNFVSKQTLANTYLKNCQPSQEYLSKYMVTSRNKSIRTYLGGLFVASGFAMFITGSTDTKAFIPFALFGSSFIGYSIHLSSKKAAAPELAEAVRIYNRECSESDSGRFQW